MLEQKDGQQLIPGVLEEPKTEELIKVIQLPEIEQQLEGVKQRIEEKIAHALSLPCTEDTYKEIKLLRSDLNHEFKKIEALRIAIKKQILEPYDEFEKTYKACVTDVFKPGDVELSVRINEVTDGIKQQKVDLAKKYFDECCVAKGIDFLNVADCGLAITMNISNKKIKETISAFVERVAKDLEMIDTQEYAAEILVEYKKSYDVSAAILKVNNRHKEVEAERQRREKLRQIEKARKAQEAKVEQAIVDEYESNSKEPAESKDDGQAFTAPVAMDDGQEISTEQTDETAKKLCRTTFTAIATREQLQELVKFMKERGIKYEC